MCAFGRCPVCALKRFAKIDINVKEYEEIKRSDRINSAGRASYIERNQWMVDESDFCLFYFNEELTYKSGTRKILKYARFKQKKLIVI